MATSLSGALSADPVAVNADVKAERKRRRPVPVAEIITVQREMQAARKRIGELEKALRQRKGAPLFQRIKLGSHSRDVTAEQIGKRFVVVGVESIRRKK